MPERTAREIGSAQVDIICGFALLNTDDPAARQSARNLLARLREMEAERQAVLVSERQRAGERARRAG